jgi:hypothetical protein
MDSHDDIEGLFRKVEKHFGEANEGIKQMFTMLIHETLAYRDELVKKNEPALNVAETQRALNALMEILKSHEFPEIDDSRIKNLVMRWLNAINENIHH